jgi:hypothetical protein
MRIIEVTLNGKHIDTIFWYGKRDELCDIKKSLVDHDGYDPAIVVEEVVEGGFLGNILHTLIR